MHYERATQSTLKHFYIHLQMQNTWKSHFSSAISSVQQDMLGTSERRDIKGLQIFRCQRSSLQLCNSYFGFDGIRTCILK